MSASIDTFDEDSWLDIDDCSTTQSLSLEDVLNEASSFDLDEPLNGVAVDDDASVFDSGGTVSQFSTISYTLDCPVRSRCLSSISSELSSLHTKLGNSTAIAIHERKLAIVTSYGTLMLFNVRKESLEWVYPADDSDGGASCVAFSHDGSYLAIGYSRGTVKLLNVSSRTIEYASEQVCQMERGILQVTFLKNNRSVIVLDSGGSVYEFHIRRSSFMRRAKEESRCVFSGCNGEVVFVLLIIRMDLMFLVSMTKVLAVSTARGGSVECAFPVHGPPDAPPLADYCIESANELSLCVCRGNRIAIYRILPSQFGTKSKSTFLKQVIYVDTKCHLVCLHFLSRTVLTAIDSREQVFAIDVESGKVTPAGSSGKVEIIFGTAEYKGLSFGGNVSEALRCVSENVCYQSSCVWGGEMLVLGPNTIYEFSLMDEYTQLEAFTARGEHASACLYLLDIIRGKLRVQFDPSFVSHAHLRLAECVRSLLEETVSGVKEGQIHELTIHYRRCIDVMLRVCISAQLFDVLYDEVYQRLEKDAISKVIMLEYLDEYVLDGALQQPPPTIVSDYLGHLINEGHFSQLQAAVVRIPIECIDLHKVMTTCRHNGLYDGIIYVMNRALNDYLGPLEEMFDNVASFASRDLLSDFEVEQGSKLMLYIHCCLAGCAYPIGELSPQYASSVPVQVYRFITSVRGKDGSASSVDYPYLRLLLLFDAQQFLHVVCTCADAPVFESEDRLQRLVELVGILALDRRTSSVISEYLRFIAHLVGTARINAPMKIVDQAVEVLLRIPSLTPLEEQSVVDLLRCVPSVDTSRILRLSSQPMRVGICSYIYRRQRKFTEVIRCYMIQPVNTDLLFGVISQLFSQDLTKEELVELNKFLELNVVALARLHVTSTALLLIGPIFAHLLAIRQSATPDNRASIVANYGPVVGEAFAIRRENEELTLTGDEELDEWLFEIAFESFCSKNNSKTDAFLMDILRYWLPLGSRRDLCLNQASAVHAIGATVMLLEARGHVVKAFKVLEGELGKAVDSKDHEAILVCVDEMIGFARAHAQDAAQHGWLLVLFHRIIDNADMNPTSEMHGRIVHIIERILESGSERALDIMTCLLEYQTFRDATYREYSPLFSSILSACSFESKILESLSISQHLEQNNAVRKFLRAATHRVRRRISPRCASNCSETHKSGYIFPCGHMQHVECCSRTNKECAVCSANNGSTSFHTSPRLITKSAVRRTQKRNFSDDWDAVRNLGPARL